MPRSYFRYLPELDYINLDSSVSSEYVRVRNIFKKAQLKYDIADKVQLFTKYNIIGDERPDNIANKLYGDSTLDWVILLSNNIINVRDEWPLDNNSFETYLLEKYGNEEKYSDVHHYETIEHVNSSGKTVVRKGLIVQEDYALKYYDEVTEQIITVNNLAQPVSNYEYELSLQNLKRTIYVIKEEYINVILNEMERIMTYKEGGEQYVSSTLKRVNNIRLFD